MTRTTENFPTLVGDVVPEGMGERRRFPFRSWALANRFDYWEKGLPMYQKCGSAAEAFFIRPLIHSPTTEISETGVATVGRIRVELQARCAGYYIDAVVRQGRYALAIEIDGMAFHHRTKEQVAADYLRQRRIVSQGYTVIRFTAPEVFADAGECWRQVYAILAATKVV